MNEPTCGTCTWMKQGMCFYRPPVFVVINAPHPAYPGQWDRPLVHEVDPACSKFHPVDDGRF